MYTAFGCVYPDRLYVVLSPPSVSLWTPSSIARRNNFHKEKNIFCVYFAPLRCLQNNSHLSFPFVFTLSIKIKFKKPSQINIISADFTLQLILVCWVRYQSIGSLTTVTHRMGSSEKRSSEERRVYCCGNDRFVVGMAMIWLQRVRLKHGCEMVIYLASLWFLCRRPGAVSWRRDVRWRAGPGAGDVCRARLASGCRQSAEDCGAEGATRGRDAWCSARRPPVTCNKQHVETNPASFGFCSRLQQSELCAHTHTCISVFPHFLVMSWEVEMFLPTLSRPLPHRNVTFHIFFKWCDVTRNV